MQVELRNISEIRPYPFNPRVNAAAVAAVAASIREFGFRQPIVVDEAGVIIAGHTRYQAALKLGLKKVPVHVATGLTPAQVKAYRIADNQTADLAEWDYELLARELEELQGMDFDLDLVGFSAEELTRLLDGELLPGLFSGKHAPPRSRPGAASAEGQTHRSVQYFLDVYGQIYDANSSAWVPFHLWPAQIQALRTIVDHRLSVVLKARQLGLTWLVLGLALWLLLFHPAATVLLFSRRDEEAVDLLKVRLRGLYERLPDWLKVQFFLTDNDHEWHWSNGSRVLAFPTTAGDSYSATFAFVDEADLVPDLAKLLSAVKPTVDGGGRLILLSRVDKSKPQSVFKRIYTSAKQERTDWAPLFLPWQARPDRDQDWYQAQTAAILHRTGSLDDLHERLSRALCLS